MIPIVLVILVAGLLLKLSERLEMTPFRRRVRLAGSLWTGSLLAAAVVLAVFGVLRGGFEAVGPVRLMTGPVIFLIATGWQIVLFRLFPHDTSREPTPEERWRSRVIKHTQDRSAARRVPEPGSSAWVHDPARVLPVPGRGNAVPAPVLNHPTDADGIPAGRARPGASLRARDAFRDSGARDPDWATPHAAGWDWVAVLLGTVGVVIVALVLAPILVRIFADGPSGTALSPGPVVDGSAAFWLALALATTSLGMVLRTGRRWRLALALIAVATVGGIIATYLATLFVA